jgi:transposase-like protein
MPVENRRRLNNTTRAGKLELRVPQDRDGRFSTELFEPYQRSEQALVATLAEMSV